MVFNRVLYLLLPTLAMCGLVREASKESRSVDYKNCGPDVIRHVTIGPCASEPCTFKPGVNVNVDVAFVSKGTASSVTTHMQGLINGIPVPHAIPKMDACVGSNLKCPLRPGEHRYQKTFPVQEGIPNLPLSARWELVDEQDQQLVCFELPFVIEE